MKSNCMNYIILSMLLFSTGTSGLKCYKCISISCQETRLFCEQVKSFVLQQLPQLYYSYDSRTPTCPDLVGAEDAWEALKSQSASCGEENDGEATCALGRFQVTTVVSGIGNVTSYGTSMGCAKRRLLEYSKSATLRRECSSVTAQSLKKDSLTHYFEIEHCSVLSDMCLGQDYCISPRSSVVKIFWENDHGGSSISPLFITIVSFTAIFLIILVLFVLGIKYG